MAVYTKISHGDLEALLLGYDIGKLKTFTAIAAGIQNSNYFIDTDIARYVLTIYENSLDYNDLPFFLDLMGHLANRGVPCPLPIACNANQHLAEIKGKPCAIVSFVKGHEVDIITDTHIAQLGSNLAKLHVAGGDFSMRRANELSVNGWQKLFDKIKNRADMFEIGIADEVYEKLVFLSKNWPKELPSGIIHGDLFPDNVLFGDDLKIAGIIDFYFACDDYYLYDLAVCLNAWCFEKDYSFNKHKAQVLFKAYDAVRKISDEELAVLPIIASGAAMRFFLTRMYDWLHRVEDAMVTPKTPLEYLQKLRFHCGVKECAEYGFTRI